MADGTKIEWTDATINFWWGCTKVSPACDHCYAEAWDKRFGGDHWGLGVARRKIKSAVKTLHRLDNGYADWAADRECAVGNAKAFGLPVPNIGIRRRVFIQSMSDLFDNEVPLEWFVEAWDTITACDRLDLQILTKRISAVEKHLAAIGAKEWPRHAGLMITVIDQAEADRDIPRLLDLKTRFDIPWVGLSIEPMLGPIDLSPWLWDNPVHEKQEKRRVCVPSSPERRSDDQAGWDDLAHPQTRMGPLEKESGEPAMQTGEGGKQRRRVSPNQSDVGRGEGICLGTPSSIPPFQRPDTREFDGEPRRREEEKQSSVESGTSDLFGTANPCSSHFEGRSHRPERREERDGEIDNGPSDGNPSATAGRRKIEPNSGRLRGDIPDNFQDSARRPTLDQVICGGESGPGARPMHPDWARSLRDQCQAAGVPFFFKQWGEFVDFENIPGETYRVLDAGDSVAALHALHAGGPVQVGKTRAGRTLDGREWNEMPEREHG